MSVISKIKILDGMTYDMRDAQLSNAIAVVAVKSGNDWVLPSNIPEVYSKDYVYLDGQMGYMTTGISQNTPIVENTNWKKIKGLGAANDLMDHVEQRALNYSNDATQYYSDLNQAKKTGFYGYNGSSQNAPTTNGGTLIVCFGSGGTQGMQIAHPNNQSYLSIRAYNNGTWTSWHNFSLS